MMGPWCAASNRHSGCSRKRWYVAMSFAAFMETRAPLSSAVPDGHSAMSVSEEAQASTIPDQASLKRFYQTVAPYWAAA